MATRGERASLHEVSRPGNHVYIWRKSIPSIEHREAVHWMPALTAEVGAHRIAVVSPSDQRRPWVEVYCETSAEAARLAKRFGGRTRLLADDRWQPQPATARGKPLAIGGKLLITAWPDEAAAWREAGLPAGRHMLCIPAAMAFGTGEHATTAMCLRLLVGVAATRRRAAWEMLDLGTGSGILALAGQRLGASNVLGLDNDGQAVRTARENARLNRVPLHAARFQRADLLAWNAEDKQWPIITANLFSDLLIRLLPKVIGPILAVNGDLILSGILAEQCADVESAVSAAGMTLILVKRRGKWRALHCRKAKPCN